MFSLIFTTTEDCIYILPSIIYSRQQPILTVEWKLECTQKLLKVIARKSTSLAKLEVAFLEIKHFELTFDHTPTCLIINYMIGICMGSYFAVSGCDQSKMMLID